MFYWFSSMYRKTCSELLVGKKNLYVTRDAKKHKQQKRQQIWSLKRTDCVFASGIPNNADLYQVPFCLKSYKCIVLCRMRNVMHITFWIASV